MPYNVEETGSLSRKAQVVVPHDEYQKDVDSALRKLSGRVKIRGFRKGKIPMGVLRKRYGDSVQRDVIDGLVNRYVNEILKDEDGVLFVAQPEVTKFNEDGVGLEFNVDFEVKPAIDPVGYLGIKVEKPRVDVAAADIDAELENMRKQFSTLEPIELRTTIKEDDVVTFDFAAVSDDPELADFKGTDAQVQVGTGNATPGIEDALLGAKFDSTVKATITPGDDYAIDNLRGRDIEVELTIKSVKQRSLPELDDDFARDTGEAETLLELRQKVREALEHQKEHNAGHFAENDLVERLLEQNEFDVPEKFLRQQIDNNIRRQLQQLQQQGMDPNSLNLNFDQIREDLRDETEGQIRAEFILLAIAEKEGLEVQQDDLQHFFAHQAMHSGVSPEQLVRWYRQDQNRMQQAVASALLEKTVNFLLEKADIDEIEWPTDEELEAKQAERDAKKAAKKPAKKKETKKAAKKAEPKEEKKAAAKEEEAAPKKEKASKPKKEAKAAKGADRADYEAKTVDELKDLLRDADLKVSGKKSELIDRLIEAGVQP